MRLENIISLTNAKLLNSPFVSSFEKLTFNVKKINRGDIFIAYNQYDIQQAIQNQAYAIITDNENINIQKDDEIAWIKVDNLNDALFRLLRFRFIEKKISAYKCDELTLKLSYGIDTNKKVISIKEDLKDMLDILWNLEENTKLLFCPTLTDENLFIDAKNLPNIIKYHIQIIEKTLFETSFIFDDKYYERILLSPFFIPFLERLLNFYKTSNIKFKIRKFEYIDNFEIVFTNKNFEVKELGSSDLVLIFEKDSKLLKKEIDFIQNMAPWARLIYLLPDDEFYDDCKNCFYYKDISELFEVLKNEKFHFALIGGVSKDVLLEYKSKKTSKQLFFQNFI